MSLIQFDNNDDDGVNALLAQGSAATSTLSSLDDSDFVVSSPPRADDGESRQAPALVKMTSNNVLLGDVDLFFIDVSTCIVSSSFFCGRAAHAPSRCLVVTRTRRNTQDQRNNNTASSVAKSTTGGVATSATAVSLLDEDLSSLQRKAPAPVQTFQSLQVRLSCKAAN